LMFWRVGMGMGGSLRDLCLGGAYLGDS